MLCWGESLFDKITKDDLIVAFFTCIYFCEKSQYAFYLANFNYRKLNDCEKIIKIIERENNRHYFYTVLLKFVGICLKMNLRMILENPYTHPHYLINNFVKNADLVDKNRSVRGDFRKKPTQYWFFNCEHTNGFTYQQTPKDKILSHDDLRGGKEAVICSEERSMISPDYAGTLSAILFLEKNKI
jgi:hypothetical protein